MDTPKQEATFETTWGILDLFGHQRLAGRISQATIAGAGFVRIDIPDGADPAAYKTRFHNPSAVYGIIPTDEATARRLVARYNPPPVQPYELLPAGAALTPASPPRRAFEEDDYQAQLEIDMVDDEGIGDEDDDEFDDDEDEEDEEDEVPEGGYERADAASPF